MPLRGQSFSAGLADLKSRVKSKPSALWLYLFGWCSPIFASPPLILSIKIHGLVEYSIDPRFCLRASPYIIALVYSNDSSCRGLVQLAGAKVDHYGCDGPLRRLVDGYLELWAMAGFPSSNGCNWVSPSSVLLAVLLLGWRMRNF